MTKAQGCSGTVKLTVKAGNRTIATRAARLSRSCTYSARLPKSHRTLKIKATFGGNDVLSGRSSATKRARGAGVHEDGAGEDVEEMVRARCAGGLIVEPRERRDQREQVRPEAVARDVDLVRDTVGGPHSRRFLRVLKRGGALFPVYLAEYDPEELAALGVTTSATPVRADGRQLEQLGRLLETGTLRVALDSTVPLPEARQAHQRAVRGHIQDRAHRRPSARLTAAGRSAPEADGVLSSNVALRLIACGGAAAGIEVILNRGGALLRAAAKCTAECRRRPAWPKRHPFERPLLLSVLSYENIAKSDPGGAGDGQSDHQ